MDGVPLLTTYAGLAFLVWKIIDWLRLATNLPGALRRWVTLTCAFLSGVVILFLYGASQLGNFDLGTGIPIVDMNWATKTLVGLAVGATAAVGVDVKAAVDSSDSAVVPSLRVPGDGSS